MYDIFRGGGGGHNSQIKLFSLSSLTDVPAMKQRALTIQGAIDYGDLQIYLFTWVDMTQDHFDVWAVAN